MDTEAGRSLLRDTNEVLRRTAVICRWALIVHTVLTISAGALAGLAGR